MIWTPGLARLAGNVATQVDSWLAGTARPCQAARGLEQSQKGLRVAL